MNELSQPSSVYSPVPFNSPPYRSYQEVPRSPSPQITIAETPSGEILRRPGSLSLQFQTRCQYQPQILRVIRISLLLLLLEQILTHRIDHRDFSYDLPVKKPQVGLRYALDLYQLDTDGRIGIALSRKGANSGRIWFSNLDREEKLIRAVRAGIEVEVTIQMLEQRRNVDGLKVTVGRAFLRFVL